MKTRFPQLLAVALIASLALATHAAAAPPAAMLGILKDRDRMSRVQDALRRVENPAAVVEPNTMHIIPGVFGVIPQPGAADPAPADPAPADPPRNPSNPDWVDVLNGIGSVLGPIRNGSGHHPGHYPGHYPGNHPGHYPGHQPGYIPSYPNPSSGGSSYVPSNPLPEIPTDPAQAVVVANPAKNGTPISFVAAGRRYSIEPGFQQAVARSGRVEVRFDRGGSFGTARYTLQSGVYQFLVTDEGWNLFRKVYRVTLDNSANPFEFRYLVGNTINTVPANGTRDYEQDQPLVVKFDPGTGRADTRTLDSGTYRIALNHTLRLWELEQVDPAAAAAAANVASNVPPAPPLPFSM